MAAALLSASLSLLSHGGLGAAAARPGELNWMSGVIAAFTCLPIVAWRRAPFAVFISTAAGSVVLAGLSSSLGLPLGPTAALYLLAASRDGRRPWTPLTSLVVLGLFAGYLGVTAIAQGRFPASEVFHTALAWAVAWFAGDRTRLLREQIAELRQRARHAEREAEAERLLAAAEERTRIARDLHDSAGHAINVIVVRAGAARLRHDDDPQRFRAALATIEEMARQIAADIDQIVGALRDRRDSEGAVDAPAGLASLDTLVAQVESTGLQVTVETAGVPHTLCVAVDQAAYRILQEALTNAARHGAGTASVALAFGEAALDLIVSNPAGPDGATRADGGHGLIGMRERATLVGGSFHEEHADGVFRIRAQLSYGAHRR